MSSTMSTPSTFVFILLSCFLFTVNHGQRYGGQQLQGSMAMQTSMPTVTVRGFLNFRTTVDGTVIVFTPSPTASMPSKTVVRQEPIRATHVPRADFSAPPAQAVQPSAIRPTRVPSGPVVYPTGLVTVLGGTVVQGGATTVYETKVIGTYISGKYAQILSSTIKIKPDSSMVSPTLRPTSTYTPQASQPRPTQRYAEEEPKEEEEITPNAIVNHKKIHPLRSKVERLLESSKNRHQNARLDRLQLNPMRSRWAKKDETIEDAPSTVENKSLMKLRKFSRVGGKRFSMPPRQSPMVKSNRFKGKLPPTQADQMQQYHDSLKNNDKTESEEQASAEAKEIDAKTKEQILESLDKTSSTPTPVVEGEMKQETPEEPKLKIDPSKVVKEVQTITSEVTQHVEGNHLQVKTLTLTTTVERTLHPSETEFNALVLKPTIDVMANDLEATSVPETPAVVISRTFSVTERTMRTTVVPVFDGTVTHSHTVTESFFIRKLITAYRTLPPGDVFLIDSTSASSMNSQTETDSIESTKLNDLGDLSMAEQTIQPSSVDTTIKPTEMPMLGSEMGTTMAPPSIVSSIESSQMMPAMPKFDLNNPLLLAAVLQNPQLAAVYLGLQQMKQQATQYNTITKPIMVTQTETIYNTKMVSFYDGRQTRSRAIIEPAGSTEKVMASFTTEVVPVVDNNFAMQQARLQNVLATQLGMPVMPMQFQSTPAIQSSLVTKTVTTVTETTMTKSKIYTLVYNAFSTRYRTITSTSVQPTTITTVLTETIAVKPTLNPMNAFFG